MAEAALGRDLRAIAGAVDALAGDLLRLGEALREAHDRDRDGRPVRRAAIEDLREARDDLQALVAELAGPPR